MKVEKIYFDITKYTDEFERNAEANWPDLSGHAGTKEDPIPWAHPIYSEVVNKVEYAVMTFVKDNPKLGLTDYAGILEDAGLSPGLELESADVSDMDGRTVLAMLVAVFRGERFCDGAISEFIDNGAMLRWLKRLRQIDNERMGRQ